MTHCLILLTSVHTRGHYRLRLSLFVVFCPSSCLGHSYLTPPSMSPSNPTFLLYLTGLFVGAGPFVFKRHPSVSNTRHRVTILPLRFSCDPGWSQAFILLLSDNEA
ncbi:hypothetical protein H4582DRAFT_227244 [Lactarius indigo]|nr:hypothetical protein H4582DRAFT_227244 [Lactarius indigo]